MGDDVSVTDSETGSLNPSAQSFQISAREPVRNFQSEAVA